MLLQIFKCLKLLKYVYFPIEKYRYYFELCNIINGNKKIIGIELTE